MAESPLQITLKDSATPFLSHLSKFEPKALSTTLRRTAGHFRKQLKNEIGQKFGNSPRKKMLRADLQDRVRRMGGASAYRSLHSSSRPWGANSTMNQYYRGGRKVPALANAIRYGALNPEETSFEFGFTGQKFSKDYSPRGRISKTAVLHAQAVSDGVFYNRKKKLFSNSITEGMRLKMLKKGLGKMEGKSNLNFPKRPVVQPFFTRNRGNIAKYFSRTFALEFNKLVRKSEMVGKSKQRVRRIA